MLLLSLYLKILSPFQEIIKNKQCGYDVRKPSYVSHFLKFNIIFNTKRCIIITKAGIEWNCSNFQVDTK